MDRRQATPATETLDADGEKRASRGPSPSAATPVADGRRREYLNQLEGLGAPTAEIEPMLAEIETGRAIG